jgi:flagellar brake protein
MKSIHPVGIDDLGPYQVHSHREIVLLLRKVMQSKQFVRMTFHDGSEAIVTSILDIDETQNWVIVDCAQNATLNQHIVECDNISFETLLDQIRILFFTAQIDACMFEERPAFRFAIPSSLIRLQRREFYRVRTPRLPVLIAVESEEGIIEVTAHLQDLSAGGVGIADEQMLLDNTPGRIYENCSITLADKSTIVVSLQIRNSQQVTLANGKKIRRLGCQFFGIPRKTLLTVQRFITKLEREQNAKTLGL